MGTEQNQGSGRVILVVVALFAVIAMMMCIAAGAFAIGRQTAVATTDSTIETVIETVVETMEVTREVPVTVEVGVPVSDSDNGEVATAVAPPPTPTIESPIISDAETLDLSLLYEVWDIIEEDFDGDAPSERELLYALIDGSLNALGDNYTTFVPADIAARLQEDMSGTVSGIGAYVEENDNGYFQIVAPIEGQPAELAGLLPGDIVIEVDGQAVTDLSFDEVILMVRGPAGTTVRLGIAREGEDELLEFEIIRARFDASPVTSEMLDGNIAYVRLPEFTQDARQKLDTAVTDLLAQNPQGLILDLRGNPGGYLNQAVEVADLFLPSGDLLYERNQQGLDRTFTTDNGDLAETIPLVVLINQGSASASEIVAGAIQDLERGTLIGTTSFGKGSVQVLQPLSDGSLLRMTIARWYTPNNNSISDAGITPDIEVEMTSEDMANDNDPQLDRAIEYLLTESD